MAGVSDPHEHPAQITGARLKESDYSSIRKEIEEIERAAKVTSHDSAKAYGHKISHAKKSDLLHRIRVLLHKLRTSTDPEGVELSKMLEILEYKISELHAHFRRTNYPPKKMVKTPLVRP
ncbi:MAG: hypothetical protein LBI30_02150 [Holosporales bacterium]|nr:hypothetical protein [Holosporales bacterium]